MPAPSKELRLAGKIISTLVKDRVHYPGRLVADTLMLISRCGLLLILYWYVFNLRGGEVNNIPYAPVAWSMFFYFGFSTLRLRDLSRTIMQDVQSGNVELFFSKPISYLLYRSWWQIGSGIYGFLVATILGSVILGGMVGIPVAMTTPIFLPTLFLTFLGATILSLILYMIVGLLAFWIEEITPIFWMLDKTIMILGGSYLPVALFPPLLYKIALWSPFGASQFVTHTLAVSWQTEWPKFLAIQIFWIFMLGSLMCWMFSLAREKVSVNGG